MQNHLRSLFRLACLLVLVTAPARSAAQGLERGDAPIDVALDATVIEPGRSVVITGRSLRIGNKRTVRIRIETPSRATKNLSAEVDGSDLYTATFTETLEAGRYTVTATATDGRQTAVAPFEVMGLDAATEAAAQALDDLAEAQSEALVAVTKFLADQPTSPPLRVIERDVPPIKERVQYFKADIITITRAIKKLEDDLPPPARPEVAKLVPELGRLTKEAKDKAQEIRDTIADVSTWNLCDGLDKAINVTDKIGKVFNFFGNKLQVARDFLIDAITPWAVQKLGGDKDAEILTKTAIKVVVTLYELKKLNWLSAAGWLNDMGNVWAQKAFDQFCQKFTGEVEATYTQDLFQGGIRFWSYVVTLKGDLVVRFRRDGGPEGVALEGEIIGKGTNFTLDENLKAIDARAKLSTIVRRVPIAYAFSPMFKAKVTGRVKGSQLALKIDEDGEDWSDRVRARVMYAFLPAGQLAPVIFWASLPYKKAGFILSRGTNGRAEFTITSDAAANVSRIRETFRREASGDTFKAKFQVDIKACDPECP